MINVITLNATLLDLDFYHTIGH